MAVDCPAERLCHTETAAARTDWQARSFAAQPSMNKSRPARILPGWPTAPPVAPA